MKKIVLCALFFSSLTILSPEPLLAKSVHKYNEQGIKYMETAEYFEAVSAFEEAYKLSAHNNTIKKILPRLILV